MPRIRRRPARSFSPNSGASSSSARPRLRRISGFSSNSQSFNGVDGLGRNLPAYVDMGDCTEVCCFCYALYWKAESHGSPLRHTRCCKSGTVVVRPPLPPPLALIDLYSDRKFKDSIRAYNMMFSMTSFGAIIDERVNDGGGPYVFKVNGQICHRLGSLCPPPFAAPRFLQLYLHDSDNEVSNRLGVFKPQHRAPLSADIVQLLCRLLHEINALVRTFRTAYETASSMDLEEFSVRLYASSTDRRYESPLPGTLGAIVSGDDDNSNEYDIVITSKSGYVRHVSKLHQSYMSLQYPLLFPFGETGWFPEMRLTARDGSSTRPLTVNAYYCNQFYDRVGVVSLLFMSGRLLQQYMVDAYLCIEHCRLQYVRLNQSKFRKEFVSGIHDAIARGDTEGRMIGKKMLLPASFVGGPRYMYQHYQDALAICRIHGNPQYFITFTCNVAWPEISRHMEAHHLGGSQNRPDIIARVFRLKILEFIKFLKQDRTFGDVSAYLYTVEFQKRGLPHCHTLLWVTSDHRIKSPADVDRHICAELPDPVAHPILHSVITKCMLHGPCGLLNPSSPCMRDGKCKFSYPKPFSPVTSFDSNGYVRYKRNATSYHELDSGVRMYNEFVVPYNMRLTMRFRAHINVEYCGWNMMIKYLFKYISKGADRVAYSVKKTSVEASTSQQQPSEPVDEVQRFVDGRYICPYEAAWRIFKFPIHERHPAVQILAVHLPNMQPAVFTNSTLLPNLVTRSGFGETTLTAWFRCNSSGHHGLHLTYVDFPSLYWWSARTRSWIVRTSLTRGTIGRLIYVPPTSGELFYLRMLLSHQKGCTSFVGLRTVSGVVYPTFFLACEAMNLIGDDREWLLAFNDASTWATSFQLRALFCNLIMYCDVSNTRLLWDEGWRRMTDDIAYSLRDIASSNSMPIDDDLLQQQLLLELQAIFQSATPPRSVSDFRIPQLTGRAMSLCTNRLIFEETNYDRTLLTVQLFDMLTKLTSEQLYIYNKVKDSTLDGKQSLLFVYGHGGTGKTFLWSTMLAYFRSLGKVALAVAGSGIASLLLPSGRTAHSRFHIPIRLTPETMCTIKKRTHMAELLAATKLIVWDEATMTDRRCFECVDRSFRDILDKPDVPFGGISMILGGDFRQTLPVKPKKAAPDIIASTLPSSYLWSHFEVCRLTQNMRLSSLSPDTNKFASWLLSVGNGDVGISLDGGSKDKKIIDIPDKLLILDPINPLQQLISFVYPPHILQHPTPSNLATRAIVCPKNSTTQEINERVLNSARGVSTVYRSEDSVQARTHRHIDLDLLYPQEYLSRLMFTGFLLTIWNSK